MNAGQFQPGQSGNPSGRPKVAAEVKALARKHGPDAIERLVVLMADKNGATAVAACKEILDRAYGKAAQPQTGEDGEGPIEMVLRSYIERAVG